MKLTTRLVAGAAIAIAATAAHAQNITGAGATFPAPIYAKWAEAYKAATGAQLNYQAIGSGGGVKQITAKTVDFGASDDPMSGEDLTKNNLLQFPAVIGGVVTIFNLPGIAANQLTLDGPVTADIFRGTIKTWNDPAIAKLNPSLKLPDTAITLVYRSDSSGTTAVFTDYLSAVSPAFKASPGEGKTVNWPTGVGGRGNAGVAANVAKIAGAIGYVEYAFAKQNKMSYASMINRDGKVVKADDLTFAAAAAKADWKGAPGFGANLNNQPGADAWPITSASFILMHKAAGDAARSAEALKFFRWALNNGQKLATELDYVPLPADVVKAVEASWKEIKDASGKAVLN
ncbi:MAG: phosphate ABC transporter substrate-binding protein PstS [Burkholderiaceae bacterium]|jgi:phosphate transport system substrate-binding protein|nr:phosphate ABC transporter substrate-binding protein PstS [Burkholderiales bacterium]MCZ8101278.1 phosphate ABC transporter substrate-binding protein PstS [Burkholderiales bacterium]MCZ8339975.1 phosphate ABC transporter substrate-binding protein PstS [Burkholderiaceae bacterium]